MIGWIIHPAMKTTQIATITILVALSIGTNYALVGVYNVKLMDLITFVGGFLFGPLVGALIGVFSWSVYGVLNPYGFVPQIWVATMVSETIYGISGGLIGRAKMNFNSPRLGHIVFLGSIGFLLTLLYDILTNIAHSQVVGQSLLITMIVGAPFTLAHEVSNALLFGTCFIPLNSALHYVIGVGHIEDIRK
jgi:uncharacterized membrane protein